MTRSRDKQPVRQGHALRGVLLGLLVGLLFLGPLSFVGCGCREETPVELAAREAKEAEAEAEQLRLEAERAKADLLLLPPTTLPSSPSQPALYAKPGHWGVLQQPVEAKQIDFEGAVSQSLTDPKGQPLAIERTRYRLTSSRPLVLAQQTSKRAETLLFCPPVGGPKRLGTRLVERRSGALKSATPQQPIRQLLDHQYHFLVLAKEPARYAFLEALQSVTMSLPTRLDTMSTAEGATTLPVNKNYRVVSITALPSEAGLLLPDSLMAWTSTAYVLWDEVDPALLRVEQREALLDWINWGGQLIVSGPDSLALLRGSFLDPILPAESTGAQRIGSQQLAKLNTAWNASRRDSDGVPKGEWSGIGLSLADGASALPGLPGLLVERRVGRGRVVVSAFQLDQRELVNWGPGVENLFNGALLRRPARRFVRDPNAGQQHVTVWAEGSPIRIDPLLNSGVRLLVHDTHKDPGALAFKLQHGEDPASPGYQETSLLNLAPPKVRGGAAAWNDFNVLGNVARSTLRRSAGVSIPGAGFVALCLLIYLVLLVPANGFFFHALGRVEWAWVAAPLIALVGAVGVVRLAQLDIGFVRSQTEVAVLEVQPDSPRGLLTRFTALYASLTTPYEIEFEQGGAVAVPFAAIGMGERYDTPDYLTEVTFSRQERSRLRGLIVASASTEFVRSAEMLDVEASVPEGSRRKGGVRMGKSSSGTPRIENHTRWALESVVVVQRRDGVRGPAQLEGCWIGQLPAGESAPVAMISIPLQPNAVSFAEQRADESVALRRPPEALDLESFFGVALDAEQFEPGERRVVARINEPLEGMQVTPTASQRRGATLLVGHLTYGPLPPPRSDTNAPMDVP